MKFISDRTLHQSNLLLGKPEGTIQAIIVGCLSRLSVSIGDAGKWLMVDDPIKVAIYGQYRSYLWYELN